MKPEVWRRVEDLCQQALQMDETRRAGFLQSACGGDDELRREVESLLAYEKGAERFIESPAVEVAGEILAKRLAAEGEDTPIDSIVCHYRIIEKLGSGGMGVVYRAEDLDLGRPVALKFLLEEVAHDSQALSRFQREARAASALNHPNIVTIYELGQVNEMHYIAMEMVCGETLRSLIRPEPLPFRKAINIAAQIAEALAKAHEIGLVHRDLKPDNLMVTQDGTVKILDFGLAKLRTPVDSPQAQTSTSVSAITELGTVMGTIGYMSPEQTNGEILDFRSDQFSFGAVLYEMVSGRPAFHKKNRAEIIAAILRDQPERLQSKIQAPAPFFWILDRCLAKNPNERYASTRDLARDLATVRDLRVDISMHSGPSLAGNMPVQRTAFIGREREVTALQQLLNREEVRLVTLTGPGGIGKTRLALSVAGQISANFAGGMYFVSLSAVRETEATITAVAQGIGLREVPGHSPHETLKEHIRSLSEPMLLLLDNFEHLLAAGSELAELLTLSHHLKVVVTSQALLRVYGEHEFPVPPLATPDLRSGPTPSTVSRFPAIRLFVERAKAVKPDFSVTKENATAIAAICARLDGLPLAIELAASRSKLLSPTAIMTRLESSLNLLSGGARDLPVRQQTLRGTVDWSYSLLSPAEQKLFRRLSVFVGGCTLEAVEAVCDTKADLGLDVLDGMASMVDKSLAQQLELNGMETRFHMLSTIREYALERLTESGEQHLLRRAHAAYYLVLAEECGTDLSTHPEWLERFDLEQNNFREALEFLIGTGETDWGMRLGSALFHFWEMREHFAEARALLGRLLELPGAAAQAKMRARLLFYSAVLAGSQGDFVVAEKLFQANLEACRELYDYHGVAVALNALGVTARDRGDLTIARSLFEQCVEAWRDLGSSSEAARGLSNLANVVRLQGDYSRASALYQECLAIFRKSGDSAGVAWTLNYLGDLAAEEASFATAASHYEESLAAFRRLDDGWGMASALCDQARLSTAQERYQEAERLYAESVQMFQNLGHKRGIARVLECVAINAALQSRAEHALRLAGAAAALRRRIGAPLIPAEQSQLDKKLESSRKTLTNAAGLKAWSSGWEMSPKEAVDEALGKKETASPD
jgi:predicted ATPase/serine/threonine protein kinase